MSPECSLSILAARTDVGFLPLTVPHLVRSCAYPFRERTLVIDTAPLGSAFINRPGVGTMAELTAIAERLVKDGWIDRLDYIDYAPKRIAPIYQKYLGRVIRETHDFRGYPIYGLLQALDSSPTDLQLHFDSDMLLYQKSGHSWIAEAAALMKRRSDILFSAPLSGPPTQDGKLHQGDTAYMSDPDGFNRFSFFTSRKFLVSRSRLLQVAPINPQWISLKRRMLSLMTGRNAIWSFEMMASMHMRSRELFRADLKTPDAWTLHTPDHGPEFLKNLPALINLIETGYFPDQQAGHFDLRMDCWPVSS